MSMRRYAVLLASAAVAAVSGVGIAAAAGGGGSSATPDTTSAPATTQPRTDPGPPDGHNCPHHHGSDGTSSTAPSGYAT
jgi:hypothetical protein